MNKPISIEPAPDSIIRDLHRIREAIVESFHGDLHALTDDARRRHEQSGRPTWRGPKTASPMTTPTDAHTSLPH